MQANAVRGLFSELQMRGAEVTPPNHSTVSRTRRLIDVETHRAVFAWVLQRLADVKLVKGTTIRIDAQHWKRTLRCAASSVPLRAPDANLNLLASARRHVDLAGPPILS